MTTKLAALFASNLALLGGGGASRAHECHRLSPSRSPNARPLFLQLTPHALLYHDLQLTPDCSTWSARLPRDCGPLLPPRVASALEAECSLHNPFTCLSLSNVAFADSSEGSVVLHFVIRVPLRFFMTTNGREEEHGMDE